MHVCTLAHVFVALYACRFVCPNLLIFLPFLLWFPVSRSVSYDGDQFSNVDNFVYPMGYWTDLFYGEQFAKHNTNSVDHSLKLSKSFMISPYSEP